MKYYRIHSLDGDGRVAFAQGYNCADDLLALAEGERHSEKHAIEVWEGMRLVARVKAGNKSLDASDQHSL